MVEKFCLLSMNSNISLSLQESHYFVLGWPLPSTRPPGNHSGHIAISTHVLFFIHNFDFGKMKKLDIFNFLTQVFSVHGVARL